MLQRGKAKLQGDRSYERIKLVCASALEMPFKSDAFDITICALATHHMNVLRVLTDMHRTIKPGGSVIIADVSASPAWSQPGVKFVLRVLTFIYFIFKEGINRAFAEAKAVSNVRTSTEWRRILQETGFSYFEITSLPANRSWIPAPMIVQARK
jgi:ubiquinone/menaquinone biosynthesis C-methylase UbiE